MAFEEPTEGAMHITMRKVVYAAPHRGMSAYEVSHYTALHGVEKVRMRLLDISDDVPGPRELAFSPDNGRTWPEVVPVPPPRKVDGACCGPGRAPSSSIRSTAGR